MEIGNNNRNSLPLVLPPPPRVADPSDSNMNISRFFKSTWTFIVFLLVCGASFLVNKSYRPLQPKTSSGAAPFPIMFPWHGISLVLIAAFWVFLVQYLLFGIRNESGGETISFRTESLLLQRNHTPAAARTVRRFIGMVPFKEEQGIPIKPRKQTQRELSPCISNKRISSGSCMIQMHHIALSDGTISQSLVNQPFELA